MSEAAAQDIEIAGAGPLPRLGRWLLHQVGRSPTASIGLAVLLVFAVVAAAAPFLASADPQAINPLRRLRPPSGQYWFGTDHLGRDIWSRALFGARVSLVVGLTVTVVSIALGLVVGLAAGYFRLADAVIMRFMDGLMAIPAILLAVALMALTRASIGNVIFAITLTETPRVVRLVRSLVLSLREEVYVQAAVTSGTRTPVILFRHILPSTVGPLVVQGTYIFAAAILIEAALSFLGAGVPTNIPSWGNMISEGRSYFLLAWWLVIIPGALLSATVLAVNMFGDGMRDALDPRLSRAL
jgi:peptide/nickel transport system permease protein